MSKRLISLALACLIISAGTVFIARHHPPHSVLIVVPDQYFGKLIIKQDEVNGQASNEKPLENFNHYVYEFSVINKNMVFVDDISHLLHASEIGVSEMSIAPLNSKVIEKSKERNEILLEIVQQ